VRSWHWIDEFFAQPADEMRVIREDQIDGRRVYVLDHVSRRPVPKHLARGVVGELERGYVARAYVDPGRGYLPLRIEYWTTLFHNGKRVGAGKVRPNTFMRTLETLEIAEVDGGRFYPVRGVVKHYGLDPKYSGKLDTIKEAIAGRVVDAPSVLLYEEEWRAASVEPDKPMPDDLFQFAFPDNTHVFDLEEERYIAGLSDAEAGVAGRRFTLIALWVVSLALGLAATAAVYFRWRRVHK